MEQVTKKEIWLVVVMSLLTTLEFSAFVLALPAALERSLVAILLLLLALLWMAVVGLSLALLPHASARAVVTILPVLVIAAVGQFSTIALGGGILLAVFLFIAERTFLREIHNRVYFRTGQIFSGGMRLVGLGLMIALTGLAWPTIAASVEGSRFEISARQVQPLLRPVEPLIRDFFPGYTKTATLDQLLTASIEEEQKKLPPGVVIDEQQITRTRQSLSQTLDQQLTGQESLADVVAHSINRRTNELTAQNPVVATAILVILVFLTFRALLPLFVWPVLGLIALLVPSMRVVGLISVQRTQAMVERLQL